MEKSQSLWKKNNYGWQYIMRVLIVQSDLHKSKSMSIFFEELKAAILRETRNHDFIFMSQKPHHHSVLSLLEKFIFFPLKLSFVKADIVHVLDHSSANILNWPLKAKYKLVTCHDLVNFLYPENIDSTSKFPGISKFLWNYSVNAIKKSDKIISVSSNTKHDLVKYLNIDPQKVKVIFPGISSTYRIINKSKESIRRDLGLSITDSLILHVGSNQPRKNLPVIFRAIQRLNSLGIESTLVKVGDAFPEELENLADTLGISQKVVHLGKTSDERLNEIYNACDILAHPSIYEGFGLTVIEAMSAGLPVVTSNNSSLIEVTEGAAILTEANDVVSVSNAIIEMLDGDVRKKYIELGLERSKKFSWSEMAKSYIKAYEIRSEK
ncbi:glycosyltransferase family 4 protein [Deinococcus sp. UYEF24]